ncbi:uncharacterized protein N7515_003315 [Penicillium bovifimosum]|uniref:Uncharacterized protein n=1 Tax=Penicillium bovifimosum TaxID=126998 RepID=A0A9W9H4E4_9EURO|nr:uncharacterized protein N7515_003315 [Penicillium bovifimosum]KAJ5138467.1 hypothetical protein N7515_003315 [Penicillium bovifimosum]
MDKSSSPAAPGAFPIPLLRTICLIVRLIYLQILYLISSLARPFRNTRRQFASFNQAIVRTETSITAAILGAQASTYNSITATGRQWRVTSGNGIISQEHNFRSMRTIIQSPTSLRPLSPWPRQIECSDSSGEQESPTLQTDGSTAQPGTNTGTGTGTGHPQESSSVYDTICKIRSATQESISTIANSAKEIMRQSPITARNLDGTPFDEERPDISQHTLKLTVIRPPVSTPEPRVVGNESARISAPARMVDHFSDPGPDIAVNGTQPVLFGASIESTVKAETLEMNHSRECHSIESYPGKFPVSDSLDFSSLATAYAVRGRGTTSVRPFSDY